MKNYIQSSYKEFEFKKIHPEVAKLLFETEEYYEIFKMIHENIKDEDINDVKDVDEDVGVLEDRLERIIIEFCDENKVSLDKLKKDDILIFNLLKNTKEKINISEKKLIKTIGIGKNRITNIKKKLK